MFREEVRKDHLHRNISALSSSLSRVYSIILSQNFSLQSLGSELLGQSVDLVFLSSSSSNSVLKKIGAVNIKLMVYCKEMKAYLDNLAQLMLDSVCNAKLLALSGESTSLLELKEELGTLEFAKGGSRVGLRLHQSTSVNCTGANSGYERRRTRRPASTAR